MSSLMMPSRSISKPGRSMTDLSRCPMRQPMLAEAVAKRTAPRPSQARGSLSSMRSIAALVHQRPLLDPGHHRTQFGADLLDLVSVIEAPSGLEARLAGLAFADPVGRERAVLDVAQDALHLCARCLVDNPRPGHVFAVLG